MVSDNEWNDFLMGNKHSPYPRVQESIRSQPNLTTPSYRATGTGAAGSSGLAGEIHLDGGSAPEPSGYIHWLDTTSRRIVEKAPIFKQLRAVFLWLENSGKWVRLPFAFLGGLFIYHVFQAEAEISAFRGNSAPEFGPGWYWTGSLFGALFGYQIPLLVGLFGRGILSISVWLCLFLSSLTAVMIGVWGLYEVAVWVL